MNIILNIYGEYSKIIICIKDQRDLIYDYEHLELNTTNIIIELIALLPLVTVLLLVSNILIFILTHTITYYEWYRFGSVPFYLLNDGKMFIITSFTSMFIHANVVHIAFNMLALVALGRVIEELVGSSRYVLIYMLSGLAGVFTHTGYSLITGNGVNTPLVGASGAVSGIIGLAAVLGDRYAYVWLGAQFIFIIAGLSSIAYFAHIGGFALGFIAGRLIYSKQGIKP